MSRFKWFSIPRKFLDCRILLLGVFLLLCGWHQISVKDGCPIYSNDYSNSDDWTIQRQHLPEQVLVDERNQLHNYSESSRYMIYICADPKKSCGGWGDRQLGIVSVYLMALASGRKFGIIVTKPCDLSAFLRPNKVNWEIEPSKLVGLEERSLYLIGNKEYIPMLRWADLDILYPEDVIYITTNYDYSTALKKNRHYRKRLQWAKDISQESIFSYVMKTLFRLNSVIEKKMVSYLVNAKPHPRMKLICAQIRIGQNPSMPKDQPRNTMMDIDVIWKFLEQFSNLNLYKIFVTTDADEVYQVAKVRFADQLVYTTGEIIHVDLPWDGEGNVCDAFTKVIIDQYILTKCDTLIVSRSYYGENAAIMRQNKQNTYLFKNGGLHHWY